MRLIDADALIDMLGVSDTDIEIQELLNEAPTVDAVPVEWIKHWWDTHYMYADAEVGDLLNDWIAERKEE